MLLLVIGMVWFASLRDKDACPTGSVGGGGTDYVTIKVSGIQLNRFITSQKLEKTACKATEDYILGLRANELDASLPVNLGPHFRLAPDIEANLSGNIVRLIVRARASQTDGAESFEVNYLTGPLGESGWQQFTLGKRFKNYVLTYDVPVANGQLGVDFLGIRPVADGAASGVEIESVTFLRL